ncbi:MAG: outer membrane beta-barrel protein [Bacteroidetes bacterium]|nr:outer membrane beta-barrel protein [Bacteroidota bacterium]
MKRLLVALLLCGALSNTSSIYAQSSTPSRFTVSTGVGLFPTYYKAGEGAKFLPMSVKLGIDVTKNFSLGAFFGYSNTEAKSSLFTDGFDSYITNKTSVFGIRAELKRDFTERIQGYGGSMIGYNYADVKEYKSGTKALVIRASDAPTPFDPNEKKGKVTYSAFLGTTVKLAKRISIYGEIGYGISIANLGITVRI